MYLVLYFFQKRLLLKLARNLEQEESDHEQQDLFGDELMFDNDLNIDEYF